MISIISVAQLNAQNLDFQCDSTFTFYGRQWVDPDWVAIYDSLNVIDYTDTELEIRFWTYAAGHTGLLNEVIVLRKPKNKNYWNSFLYSGFINHANHKSMETFFLDNEINCLSKRKLKRKVAQLLENDILTLEEPTYESLSPIIDLRGLSTSHPVVYTIEILSENCARKYSIGGLWANMDILQGIDVFVKFNAIKSIFLEIGKKE
ncbi:hypothetical protein G3O08_15440 [Cryomorpha ignava]|uniref:Uncharacterized protein n=1 Tax=Cryomorpha ignava TaxID=101383 RepID=A0A7K3WTS5_9FLAO|nr:hypothetical protein [Cryomorpha ignava]NEN24894.1 hypothetical protein [Cryomorpha ignava]